MKRQIFNVPPIFIYLTKKINLSALAHSMYDFSNVASNAMFYRIYAAYVSNLLNCTVFTQHVNNSCKIQLVN